MTTNTLVKVEETAFLGYGTIRPAPADLAVLVVPDVGGRILSVKHRGEEPRTTAIPRPTRNGLLGAASGLSRIGARHAV
jgi:hypothetical protein